MADSLLEYEDNVPTAQVTLRPMVDAAAELKTVLESNVDTNTVTDAQLSAIENLPADTTGDLAAKAATTHNHDQAIGSAVTPASNELTIDFKPAGSKLPFHVIVVDMADAVDTLTITNPPASGTVGIARLYVTASVDDQTMAESVLSDADVVSASYWDGIFFEGVTRVFDLYTADGGTSYVIAELGGIGVGAPITLLVAPPGAQSGDFISVGDGGVLEASAAPAANLSTATGVGASTPYGSGRTVVAGDFTYSGVTILRITGGTVTVNTGLSIPAGQSVRVFNNTGADMTIAGSATLSGNVVLANQTSTAIHSEGSDTFLIL